MAVAWHTKKLPDIFSELGTSGAGLSSRQIEEQRKKFGSNVLPEAKGQSLLSIFLSQFRSPLIYILAGSAVLMMLFNDKTDAAIIFFILAFNSVVGTIQEGKAQNTLKSLKQLVETKASVLRDSVEEVVPDTEIVAGDILVLHEGDKVAADARIISANNLTVDESALTGESEPVNKNTEGLRLANLPTAEQKNMLFKGTHVVAGSGEAVVVRTGLESVIGRISAKIATIESEDPIKKGIKKLSRLIIVITASICSVIFLAGLAAGNPVKDMFATVVSLAVSVIPEGLPVALTLILATGVWRMSKNHALVKKLQAVESLGQATIIAVDKTGTITKNELTVTKVYVNGKTFDVKGSGYEPAGHVVMGETRFGTEDAGLLKMGKISAFSANAYAAFSEEKKIWQVSGDPTEAAMLTFAEKLFLNKKNLEEQFPRVGEIPFSYLTKYHAVLNQTGASATLSLVGAPEAVLNLCSSVWRENQNALMTPALLEEMEKNIIGLSKQGLRVLAYATKILDPSAVIADEVKNLSLVGFIGLKDTLRPESTEAVAKAKEAGIKVVMITGDHKLTAQAIAQEAGIFSPGSRVLEGNEIDGMSPEELTQALANTTVFARVTPEHKMQIIQSYKARGEIIAMTGDGVNDAPSLVAADLGVAMGRVGTEVAKEAADIVLLDDNFGNIIAAVDEGRNIYKTIKKVILYLFSTGLGEVAVIAGAIFMGLPLPLLPSHIIWLNFVTDGFLTVALGMEPKESGLLQERDKPKSSFVDRAMGVRMAIMALTMGAGSLWIFSLYAGGDQVKAWTMTMTVLAIYQWFNAWNCRSEKVSLFKSNLFSNKFLVAATVTVFLLQLAAVYTPFLQRFLKTTPLTLSEWLIALALASTVLLVEEVRKAAVKSFSVNAQKA